MGLISFLKGAGAKIFGKSDEPKQPDKAAVILEHINSFGFQTEDLKVVVEDETVILTGKVDTIANKNKIVIAAGNVEGISKVDDRLAVLPMGTEIPVIPPTEPEKEFYTVVPGDTLSKISKRYYGDPNKYQVIFEANTPMLTHPDKIYPGQVLVIPPLDK